MFAGGPKIIVTPLYIGLAMAATVDNHRRKLVKISGGVSRHEDDRRRKGLGAPWRVHAEHEPITGVWGQSPQRGPGAEPLVRG